MKKIFGIFLSIIITMMLAGCGTGDVNGGATADIEVIKVANVASEASPGLGSLMFEFKDADGRGYYGVISGMRNYGIMTADVMEEVAKTVGSHFAGGSQARIVGTISEGTGGNEAAGDENSENGVFGGFDLVDAEKYGGKDNSSVTTGAPYGDANLCWAASTADMLVMAGWTDGMNEDEIMSEFTENYFDEGLFQHSGIKFFMNGVNEDQSSAEKADKTGAKNAVFVANDTAELMSSTQARDPNVISTNRERGERTENKILNVGHYTNYAAECVATTYNASDYETSELGDIIIDAIDHDGAVGLDVVFYNGDSRVGVHALTVTGYIKAEDGSLAAFIIADSDNHTEWKAEYGESAAATLAERQARPNSYDMFLAGSFTHQDKDYLTLQDYKYSNPKMKYDNAVIQQIAVLRSIKAADSALEPAGTRDAANTTDILLRSGADAGLDTKLTGKAGTKIEIPLVVTNRSYKGYAAKDKPIVKGRMIIRTAESPDEESRKVGEEPFEFSLATDSYTTGEANCDFSITLKHKFGNAGKYTVDVEILGVYSGASKLAEAYTVNNYLKNAASVVIE